MKELLRIKPALMRYLPSVSTKSLQGFGMMMLSPPVMSGGEVRALSPLLPLYVRKYFPCSVRKFSNL